MLCKKFTDPKKAIEFFNKEKKNNSTVVLCIVTKYRYKGDVIIGKDIYVMNKSGFEYLKEKGYQIKNIRENYSPNHKYYHLNKKPLNLNNAKDKVDYSLYMTWK